MAIGRYASKAFWLLVAAFLKDGLGGCFDVRSGYIVGLIPVVLVGRAQTVSY